MVKVSWLQRKGLVTLSLLHSTRHSSPAGGALAHRRPYSSQSAPSSSSSEAAAAVASPVSASRPRFGRFGAAPHEAPAAAEAEAAEAEAEAEAGTCGPGGGSGGSRDAATQGACAAGEHEATAAPEAEAACLQCARSQCPPCRRSALAVDAVAVAAVPRGGHGGHGHGHGEADLSSAAPLGLPLNAWKCVFQAVLTTLNVLCWLVPLRSKTISDNTYVLGLANAFSGGVFLSLAFGHLIPECVRGFAHNHDYAHDHAHDHARGGAVLAALLRNEATPYMLVLAGYLLIFFVEKVAFDAHGLMHAADKASATATATATSDGDQAHSHSHSHSHSHEASAALVANGDHAASAATLGSGRSAVILLGALAVHSVLEMTALGLANTFGESALLSLSIALHQPAESIALLIAFLKSGMPKPLIVQYLSIFSAMGPCGVALGMAVQEFASPIVDSIMLAIVAGTFVYVGATEVIPEEWNDDDHHHHHHHHGRDGQIGNHKWVKFGALMLGICSVFAITQYTMTLEA